MGVLHDLAGLVLQAGPPPIGGGDAETNPWIYWPVRIALIAVLAFWVLSLVVGRWWTRGWWQRQRDRLRGRPTESPEEPGGVRFDAKGKAILPPEEEGYPDRET